MYRLNTEIEINAAPEQVWKILTAGDNYGAWNPFVRRLTGRLRTGEKLFVLLTPPGGKGFVFRPRVIKRVEGCELAWLGRLLMPGIFSGEHHFEVHPIGNNKSRFVQWEKFSGLLVPLMKKMLSGSTKKGFDTMNQALKKEAEAAVKEVAS